MAKYRKVIFFDDSLGFLKDLTRGGRLVNVIMKQVFTGTRAENLQLALDLMHGKRRLDVHVVHDSVSGEDHREKTELATPSRIQVKVKADRPRSPDNEKREPRTKGHGKRLLDDLSRMAREFGE